MLSLPQAAKRLKRQEDIREQRNCQLSLCSIEAFMASVENSAQLQIVGSRWLAAEASTEIQIFPVLGPFLERVQVNAQRSEALLCSIAFDSSMQARLAT